MPSTKKPTRATKKNNQVKPKPKKRKPGAGRKKIADADIVPGSRTSQRRAAAAADLPAKPKPKRSIFRMSKKRLVEICKTKLPKYDPWADSAGYSFDVKLAKRALGFFHKELRHSQGAKAREPFELEPWQVAVIANLFGWIDTNGFRRYREALIMVPRKNGKSTLAAGLILYTLLEDQEPAAQVIGAAASYDSAGIVFDSVEGFLEYNDELAARCKVHGGYTFRAVKTIAHPKNVDRFGIYKPVVAKPDVGHGLNTHVAVIDELHLQPNRDLVDSLTTSQASEARKQPLIVYITTADYARPSICNEKRAHAEAVCDGGRSDPQFLPAVWAASREDNWLDEKVWAKANPNLEISVSLKYLRRQAQRAVEEPSYEQTFRRLHLNVQTESIERWLPLPAWDLCADVPEGLDGQKCYAGLDLASTLDTTALVLVFQQADGSIDVLSWFWVPSERARMREKRDKVPYSTFAASGELFMTDGPETDYFAVTAHLQKLAKRYKIVEIAYDRYNSGTIERELTQQGFKHLIAYNQGFLGMNSPCRQLEKLVAAGKVRHGGHGLLRYQAAACAVREQSGTGYIMPSKKKSTDRIDGVAALLMGLGRAMIVPTKKKKLGVVESW